MSEQDGATREAERREDAEEMARLQEQINNLPVSEHILFMLHSLSSLAIDRLGMAPGSAARKDLGQAHLAIDAFKALLGVLEQARPTEEVAAHRGVLSQLQLAFVGESGRAAPSETEGRGAEPPAPAPTPEPMSEPMPTPEPAAKPAAKTGGAAKSTGTKTAGTKTAGAKTAASKTGAAKKGTAAKGGSTAKGGKKAT